MLYKNILVGATLAVALSAAVAATWPVIEGSFSDGSTLAFQCQGKFEGKIPILFQTAEGKTYKAVLTCGKEV